jgi:hypothetical protein
MPPSSYHISQCSLLCLMTSRGAWTPGESKALSTPSKMSMMYVECFLMFQPYANRRSPQIVFQMTVRMAACRELASDLPALTAFQKHYWILEKSATPTALLLPWFPGPAKRAKEASTKALFTTLWDYIEERKKASVPSSDAIDMLLGLGMSNGDIIQFVLAVIFAGVVNTGINCTSPHRLRALT